MRCIVLRSRQVLGFKQTEAVWAVAIILDRTAVARRRSKYLVCHLVSFIYQLVKAVTLVLFQGHYMWKLIETFPMVTIIDNRLKRFGCQYLKVGYMFGYTRLIRRISSTTAPTSISRRIV
jgi:hypothetical protein